jgi:hypothetical protein
MMMQILFKSTGSSLLVPLLAHFSTKACAERHRLFLSPSRKNGFQTCDSHTRYKVHHFAPQ